jgi:hypothetical protein
MASTRAARQRRIAVTLVILIVFGRMGVALVAAGMTTATSPVPNPNAQFDAFKKSCTNSPATYAIGAVRGVYHEQVVPGGSYVDQICSLYGSPRVSFPTGKWLRDYTRRDCIHSQAGGTDLPVGAPVPIPAAPPTAINGRPGASLGIPLVNEPVAPGSRST